MRNIVSIISTCRIVLGAALLATIAVQAHAGQTPPKPSPTPKGFECGGEAITGSGAGFKSSQEESENAAVANWLEKAKAVYDDASWETAKDAGIQCVKQGLYSKCFANGFPCHPKTPD